MDIVAFCWFLIPIASTRHGIEPKWSTWLSTLDRDGARILAVSPGSLSQAIGYARDQQWPVKVGTLGGTEVGGNRSRGADPWVFALDQDGRVVDEGHGSRLLEVAQNSWIGRSRDRAEPLPSAGGLVGGWQ